MQQEREIYRGWMIIRGYAGDPTELAHQIWSSVNSKGTIDEHSMNFAVRADTIMDTEHSNGISLILPLCAEREQELEDMAARLQEEYSLVSYELAIVDVHYPTWPHEGWSWVTEEESRNPRRGPQGLNPW